MTGVLVPARRHDPEWMDRIDNRPADVAGALRDIHAVNRLLGGSKTLVDAVRPFLLAAGPDAPLSVLDVGTGGADLPLDLVKMARRVGRPIRVVAVDRDPAALRYARARIAGTPEIEIAQADAIDLPYPGASFDLVTASMFLHHFAHAEAVRIVGGFLRVARRAVLVNDLRRHVLPWAFIGLAARLSLRHPMFVHDAPLSVLRGFTPDELRAIAADAGARDPEVAQRFPYRLLLTIRTSEHPA